VRRRSRFGVGSRPADQPRGLVGRRRDVDRVGAALAHLAPIDTEQCRSVSQQGLGLAQQTSAGRVTAVEAARDQARLLEMGQLVGADRDERRAAEEDVGRLMDGIGEHQAAERAHAGRARLLLDRRVAQQLGHGDEAEEREQQLVERRDL
jgi:hypothetical protein